MAQINWTGRAAKDLRKLPSKDQTSVRSKVNSLDGYPDIKHLDFKKLTDKENLYRLRVGEYRVLIEMRGGEQFILTIQRILRRSSTTY